MRIHVIILNVIYPLVLEFEIPTEPSNVEDKMTAPRREPMSVHITLYSFWLLYCPSWPLSGQEIKHQILCKAAKLLALQRDNCKRYSKLVG